MQFWMTLIVRNCRDRLRVSPSRTMDPLTAMTDPREINALLTGGQFGRLANSAANLSVGTL
jgi:hypothetical protein